MVQAQCVLFTVFFGCEMCRRACRGTFLLLLLFAVNAKVFGEDNKELMKQLHVAASDQMEHMTIKLNMMVSYLQANNKMSQQFTKMEERFWTQENILRGMSQKVDALLSSVQDNKNQIKNLVECQKWLMKFNQTNFINATGKNFYYRNGEYMTWYKTRDWCTDNKMQMATIKVPSVMKQVSKELNTLGDNSHGVWLAASDIGRTPGHFYWADGTAVDNSTWSIGEPDKAGKEFGNSWKKDSHGVWLDASDIGRRSGRFYWGDGTQVDNLTWMIGQPDKFDAATSACVYIHSASNTAGLKDWQCSGISNTLCQLPAALRPCLA